jgi:hypothetical protein
MDKILIRSTPKIAPSLISLPDLDGAKTEDGQGISQPELNQEGHFSKKGTLAPIVQIGGLMIPEESVSSMTVWQQDLLPTISLTIIDNGSIFGAGLYPIADIIISVFIRSQNKKLKSLSADFLITAVGSIPIPNSNQTIYNLIGELHVPKINGNFSRAYSKLTSLEALKKVADELRLGFADNQPENTNDRMTWIMPNYNYKSFISHVKKMAYRDDNHFFDCFIDRYYTLNFINVEKMFSQDPETDKGFLALEQNFIDKRRAGEDREDDGSNSEVDIILNNHRSSVNSEFYISEFSVMGHHGEVLANHGLRKHAYWYDHGGNTDPNKQDSVNFVDHYIEPLQTPASNDGLAPHTVNIPDFRDGQSSTGVWKGVRYSNAHPDYKFAMLLNDHNLFETKKNELGIALPGININVLRGSRVAVMLYLERQDALTANSARNEPENRSKAAMELDRANDENTDNPTAQILDKLLSGFYYVSSIKYTYVDGKFQTDMILSRRHWLLPRPKNKVSL